MTGEPRLWRTRALLWWGLAVAVMLVMAAFAYMSLFPYGIGPRTPFRRAVMKAEAEELVSEYRAEQPSGLEDVLLDATTSARDVSIAGGSTALADVSATVGSPRPPFFVDLSDETGWRLDVEYGLALDSTPSSVADGLGGPTAFRLAPYAGWSIELDATRAQHVVLDCRRLRLADQIGLWPGQGAVVRVRAPREAGVYVTGPATPPAGSERLAHGPHGLGRGWLLPGQAAGPLVVVAIGHPWRGGLEAGTPRCKVVVTR